MITLIIGTPNSGKSEYAERLAVESGCRERYYLATMTVCDEAGMERVLKHRKAREGKGFVTLEIPYAVDGALKHIVTPDDSVILLECISNLVGNEMHDDSELAVLCQPDTADPALFTDRIIEGIVRLAAGVKDIIIVTNEYDPDETYDEETALYIRLCSMVNERLRSLADRVTDLREDM